MLVVLEGLPGAGKTTVLRHLNAAGIATINELVLPEPAVADENFFLENDRRKYDVVTGDNTVMDRNFISTLCFNTAHDSVFHTNRRTAINQSIIDMQTAGVVWQPDLYVWLRCSVSTSLERQSKTNDPIWSNAAFLQAVDDQYRGYFAGHSIASIVINTDELSCNDVAQRIIKILSRIDQPKEVTYE